MRAYLTEVLVLPESPLIGKTIAQSGLGRDLDLTVAADRAGQNRIASRARGDTVIQARRCHSRARAPREDILKIKDTAGIDIKADVKLADPKLEDKDTGMVEMIILPRLAADRADAEGQALSRALRAAGARGQSPRRNDASQSQHAAVAPRRRSARAGAAGEDRGSGRRSDVSHARRTLDQAAEHGRAPIAIAHLRCRCSRSRPSRC